MVSGGSLQKEAATISSALALSSQGDYLLRWINMHAKGSQSMSFGSEPLLGQLEPRGSRAYSA